MGSPFSPIHNIVKTARVADCLARLNSVSACVTARMTTTVCNAERPRKPYAGTPDNYQSNCLPARHLTLENAFWRSFLMKPAQREWNQQPTRLVRPDYLDGNSQQFCWLRRALGSGMVNVLG
jgi:hypothetical protein